ncbi:MAG TPA: methionine adenosyltransferase [Vicinamibacterales bacterium]
MSEQTYTFTSESVSEGHPDKVCDFIADSILDACLEQDPQSHVACEVLCKDNQVVLAGEISTNATIDYDRIAREAIRQIGYTDPAEAFNADDVQITRLITQQSGEINAGVRQATDDQQEQGAGDQGIMFGYATAESAELMPLPILLAHRLTKGLATDRRSGKYPWLRPDSKSQVSVVYRGNTPERVSSVLVSTQHAKDISQADIRDYVVGVLAPRELGEWFRPDIEFIVNPSGSFAHGGPSADCGVTGRKIIVDTYGGAGRHGGGAFSGKDPSKVDRSGAYYCRYVARRIVEAKLAERAEVQVSYAIGRAKPMSIKVDTFGTGDPVRAERFVAETFDFRPAAIIRELDLLRPIYRLTTNYGHFGKAGLPWEKPVAVAV